MSSTEHHELQYIGGGWTASTSREYLDVVNPASQACVARVPSGSADDVDAAVHAARGAFDGWSALPPQTRATMINDIARGMQARRAELAQTISLEMGSPLTFADRAQVGLPISTFETAATLLETYSFEWEVNGATVIREPIGVVGAITPWNYPLHQVACKVGAALATGCTVVLKPSEVAPLSAVILTEIIEAAGVPAGVFNLVQGTGPVVGEAIAAHADVDMVSFTGSTAAGRRVSEVAAATIKRVQLELGGKSANIILDDADLELAITSGVGACYTNSGQTCSALTRMLVPRARLLEVEEIARRAAESFLLGDPGDDRTKLGPLVSSAQQRRVEDFIASGIAEGARLVTGGTDVPEELRDGCYVVPTIFSDVTPDMTIAREEIFGPVLSIMAYDTEDEAVRIANDSNYGLSGGVWSADPSRAKEVARRMRTGQVSINGAGLNPLTPFGGYKQSGNGRERGSFGLDEYVELKALL